MPKPLAKISRKVRPRTIAGRPRRGEKAPLVFTAEDMKRQREAILRLLAVPTVAVSDPTVSEAGVYQPRKHEIEV